MSAIVSLERVYEKVIFDMDGTLVDSRAVVERAWRTWALKHGVSPEEVLAISHGRRTHEVLQLFAPEGVDIDREASELEMEEADHAEDICAVAGALELLRWIPDVDWAGQSLRPQRGSWLCGDCRRQVSLIPGFSFPPRTFREESRIRRAIPWRLIECARAQRTVWFSRTRTPASWPRRLQGVTSWQLQQRARPISKLTAFRSRIFIAFPSR